MGRRGCSTWLPWLIACLGAVPRLRTAVGGLRTADEELWMGRSLGFSDALTSGDLASASASAHVLPGVDGSGTMPGVTTMWVGTVARGVWGAGRSAGLWAGGEGARFTTTTAGWTATQVTMAAVTSVLLGLLVLLAIRWVGCGPAAVAGVLVATEPFIVAHGAVVHTDELLALLGAGALVATALALGVPHRTSWAEQRWAALMAGGLWGAALLTKVSALMFLPGVALLAIWALRRAGTSGPGPDEPDREAGRQGSGRASKPTLGTAGWWCVGAVAVVVAFYPALWVAPGAEVEAAIDSLRLASEDQWQFFLGQATDNPGPAFYLVALPLRVTPWFLISVVLALGAIAWHRPTRPLALALGCMLAPPFVIQSLATKQFARYGLVLLILLAVVVGVAVDALADRLRRELSRPRLAAALAGTAATLAAVHSVVVAPWGLGYFNPILGGGTTAERAIVVGWGEGIGGTGDVVEGDRTGSCEGVTYFAFIAAGDITCGEPAGRGEVPTYIAIYVAERQRMADTARSQVVGDRELVGEVRHRGISYVEVFGPPEDEAGAVPAHELLPLFGY